MMPLSPPSASEPAAGLRVDAHLHFWRYAASEYPWIAASMAVLARDRLPDDVALALWAAGIQAALAVQARPLEAENDWLLGLARQHSWIAGVVGWVDLERPAQAAIERWCGDGLLRGLRPMLQDDPDPESILSSPVFGEQVARVQAAGRVLEILLRGRQLLAPSLAGFCARHGHAPLVLDHIGKPAMGLHAVADDFRRWADVLRELARMPHVAVKVSGLVTEWVGSSDALASPSAYWPWLDEVLACFGPDRLLYGSDWPVCTLVSPYGQVQALAADWAAARLSADEQRGFWGENAARIYGLRAREADNAATVSAS